MSQQQQTNESVVVVTNNNNVYKEDDIVVQGGGEKIMIDDGASKQQIQEHQQEQHQHQQEQQLASTTTTTSTSTTSTTETIRNEQDIVNIKAKWNGKEYNVTIDKNKTVGDLKRQLESMTNVLTKRQKILGLTKGMLPPDETALSTLGVKQDHNIIMIGTPEAKIVEGPPPELVIDVFNDMDFDYIPDNDEISQFEKNRHKLQKTKKKAEIDIINVPRPNKKLLVLDLDHTILDFKDQDVSNMKRPGLEEFLIESYKYYDIAIWSQTSWKWIEIKLTELNLLTNPLFKIGFVLDQTLMFRVTSFRPNGGKERTKIKHPVKALDIIWSHKVLGKYYNAQNTLHIDDLSRNFAMNPKNGVHIPAFKRSDNKKQPDTVLYHLTKYLTSIALETDVTKINHLEWLKKV